MDNLTSPPLPLHCHPAYEHVRNSILDLLNEDRSAIVVPLEQPEPAILTETDYTALLEVGKAWGLAPWTGHPAHYEWQYAVDNQGRAVAADSHLIHEPHPLDRMLQQAINQPLDHEILDGR